MYSPFYIFKSFSYQTDGTYSGDAADFKAGWAAVASACKEFAPQVKMWWTPNVASDSNYAQYEPEDMSTVDLVGVDYYPKSLSTGSEFTTTMKSFHDKYAVEGRQFAIGETGSVIYWLFSPFGVIKDIESDYEMLMMGM